MPPFDGRQYIADKSVWERVNHPEIAEDWREALVNRQIATCSVTDFELLYSTRNQAEYEALEEQLSALRKIHVTRTVCEAAQGAMTALAAKSAAYHRVPIPDLLIAACAAEVAIGVLHYDHHFDRIAEVMEFESRWVAAPGSL